MVRKQFYPHKRQEILLERLSEACGQSQVEIIRQAIEREAAGFSTKRALPNSLAMEDFASLAMRKRS